MKRYIFHEEKHDQLQVLNVNVGDIVDIYENQLIIKTALILSIDIADNNEYCFYFAGDYMDGYDFYYFKRMHHEEN